MSTRPSPLVVNVGEQLRAARIAAGLSLRELARRVPWSHSALGHYESGERRATPEVIAAYERATGRELDDPAPTDPLRVAHEWLLDDDPVSTHHAAGRRVSDSLVAALDERVIALRLADDTVPAADLVPVILSELAGVQRAVTDSSYTETTGRALLRVVGELAQLAGWTLADLGRTARAETAYMTGVQAARDAGHRALVGQLLSCVAYQAANLGGRDALLLARSAACGAADAPPVVRALLHERVAWAAARAREPEIAHRALDTVDAAYAERGTEEEPHWVYWMNRREIDIMAARVHIELGRPAVAAPILHSALAGYPAEHHREVALYLTWVAESHARDGERDAALDVIERITTMDVSSARVERRLEQIQHLIKG